MLFVEKMIDRDTNERLYGVYQCYPSGDDICVDRLGNPTSYRKNVDYIVKNSETNERFRVSHAHDLSDGVIGVTRQEIDGAVKYHVVSWTEFDISFFKSFKYLGSETRMNMSNFINGATVHSVLGIELSKNGIYCYVSHAIGNSLDCEETHTTVQWLKHHTHGIDLDKDGVFNIKGKKYTYRFKVVDMKVFNTSLAVYKLQYGV